jgi:hypothetical protein
MVAAAGRLQREVGKAVIEVALDGAQVDAELLRQGPGLQHLALVELE